MLFQWTSCFYRQEQQLHFYLCLSVSIYLSTICPLSLSLSLSLSFSHPSLSPYTTSLHWTMWNQAGIGILATVLGVAFQNVVPFKQEEESADPESVDRKLRVTFFGGGAIAAGIAVLTVLGSRLSQPEHTAAAWAVLAGLCALVVWTAFSSGPIMVSGEAIRRPLLWSSEEVDVGSRGVEEPLIGGASASSGGPPAAVSGSGESSHPALTTIQHEEEEDASEEVRKAEGELLEAEPEVSLLEAWATSEYWLLYAVVTIGTGTGLTIVNNLGQVRTAVPSGETVPKQCSV